MEAKVYVGNLSYEATEDDLRALFAQSGTVKSVTLIRDRETGRSKGFAFVEMGSQAEVESAISALNGTELHGRELKVSVARPRESREGGGYGGGRTDDRPRGRGGPRRSW